MSRVQRVVERLEPFAVTVMRLSDFDPEEIVTQHGYGPMTLRTAVERVLAKICVGWTPRSFGRASRPFWVGLGSRSLQRNGR